ncbi:MAG: hypothetical protein J1E39_03105 [Eubacterium sp.]|nr:hypothetical protein [Eubacterium sp.]
MKILENLWYGNINPVENYLTDNKQFSQLSKQVVQDEEELFPLLSDKAMKAYEQLAESRSIRAQVSECEAFTAGFRLGVRMMLEITEKT